ncbi:glycosyltransferase family 4 protein [Chryseolinea lacunae]|uniref:Glycosyltransferase family 4 protein n=1 Tax=Chryseolinea lacunae TaxID=2801331 RepID=A0ABS1KVC1_9BACT|nr:glycosyltransferase family 4 protein [Chryseolinea lacunae]MBL0742266.1 glycosyltransferase family 4 protein [Chryseolinea lacunae]
MTGGVGGGFYSQGYPALQLLVGQLATTFDITVYSHLPPNADFVPENFRIVSYRGKFAPGLWRWVYLVLMFAWHHLWKSYDVVFSFWGYPSGVLAYRVAAFFRRPSVIYLHGGDSVGLASVPYGVFCNARVGAWCRHAYLKCTTLLTISVYQAQVVKQNGVARSIGVVHYGVDLRVFSYRPKPIDTNDLRFIHVANHTPIKDQFTMLRAFAAVAARLPSRLLVVGADFYDGQLKRWCESLGVTDRVDFLEPQAYADMPRYYHACDIMLHTSLYEAQGLVFVEAAACGALIAGTNVGMLADMGDTCGLIVAPGDATGLAEKIIVAVKDPARIDAMRKAARKVVEGIGDHYTATQITKVIDEFDPTSRS